MHIDTGIIKVIRLDSQGEQAAWVECPQPLIPDPGQYLLASNPAENGSPLGQCLFRVGMEDETQPYLGPIPRSWTPGTRLDLRGPLGKGFRDYAAARRLALATFSGSLARLLPLLRPALKSGADVTVFLPDPLNPGELPAAVEVQPLHALAESLSWPNLLALELPLPALPKLRSWLQLDPHERLPCPAEALIVTPMPCAALGDCGACAVPTRKGNYHFSCKDGPVFDLNELIW